MKTISVIIPMYNSEAFIRQCIQSVLNQTYEDFEIIVVDDGSKDRGPEICEEIGKEDSRICIHRNEKQGVSAARNYGLGIATGKYIFFLDSDDAIHPHLFEEMVYNMEAFYAGMALCAYEKVDSQQLQTLLEEASCEGQCPRWQVLEPAETEERFHRKNAGIMTGIGGKMIRMDLIGDLRFDTNLINGEDTLFLYFLLCRQVCTVFTFQKWYYYRMHSMSVTHLVETVKGERYFECIRKIRDSEYQKGRIHFAEEWEWRLIDRLKKSYLELKHVKDRQGCRKIKKLARLEEKHPLYSELSIIDRVLFSGCFCNILLFHFERKCLYLYWLLKSKITMNRLNVDVGILTFQCADNFGAMLQTYGLKTYLNQNGIRADVIRYDPPFMTGRYWLIPYFPYLGKKHMRRMYKIARSRFETFRVNLRAGGIFFIRRARMRQFREEYLVEKGQPRLLSINRFQKLPYAYYIVGSDQIWNPDITCGLRKAYFGAFDNKKKKKVIAYGASFGGTSLASQFGEEFFALIQNVDAVSVREEEAIPYVKQFYKKDVISVLDPVFFLEKNIWQKMEHKPDRRRFIFVYITEKNQELSDYVCKLSQEKNLPVVEISADERLTTGKATAVDFSAGPSEFLGYIHRAEYVVSNSFHAVAFSIIYQKQFLAFTHSNRGARLRSVLQVHGLESRLCQTVEEAQIDAAIRWDEVRKRTLENSKRSGDFLLNNILE